MPNLEDGDDESKEETPQEADNDFDGANFDLMFPMMTIFKKSSITENQPTKMRNQP